MHDPLPNSPIPLSTHGTNAWIQKPRMGESTGAGQGRLVSGDKGRFSEVHAKPRIWLKHSWQDNGWEYQQWVCVTAKYDSLKPTTGLGPTPAAAYADWKRQIK